ncbi:MAG TPA: DUF58 domain-containing protein [Armatimonadota bacterium]|jgi:uncharacterized protein (DUF58 family)
MVRFTELGRMVLVFFLCFFLIGYVHGSASMFMIASFCLLILFVALFLAWYGLRGIRCHRTLPGSTIFSHDPLDTTIVLTEPTARWRMLEVYDTTTNLLTGQTTHRHMAVMPEGAHSLFVSAAGVRQQARRHGDTERIAEIADVMHFPLRGHYRLGPFRINSYDPFGLLYLQRAFRTTEEVIVYPHPLPMPEIALSGGLGPRQLSEVRPVGHVGESADFHGIRPYVQGDDLRRVHWKSTAHTGKLAVKEFEYHASGAVQVILDLDGRVQSGHDERSTLEAAITLGASVLHHALSTGNQAGLLTTGKTVVTLPQESGQRQLHRALEALALAKADGTVTLAQALASGEAAPSSGRCTTVVITSSVDTAIIGPLMRLRGRSAQVLLVLLNAQSFADAQVNPSVWQNSLPARTLQRLFLRHRTAKPARDESAHQALLHAAAAGGIDVYPVTATLPLHQVLQRIRTRFL